MTDEHAKRVTTDRGLDRLTYFTDAIAAIAITLLVLPLVEPVAEAAAGGQSASDFLHEHVPALLSFALSFLLIARLWMSHHSIFEYVENYTTPLRWLSLAWAFTIVLLPLPTAMLARWKTTPLIVAFYIGTLAASSIVMTAIIVLVHNDPRVRSDDNPVPVEKLQSSVVTSIEFVIALLAGTLVPGVNFFALFVLLLSIPVDVILRIRARRRRTDAA